MTDKELKEKVADIIMEAIEEYNNNDINRPMIASLYSNKIISFFNSLPEEPVSEELEEAVNSYIGYPPEVDECSSVYGKRLAFKAGAKWQKEHGK